MAPPMIVSVRAEALWNSGCMVKRFEQEGAGVAEEEVFGFGKKLKKHGINFSAPSASSYETFLIGGEFFLKLMHGPKPEEIAFEAALGVELRQPAGLDDQGVFAAGKDVTERGNDADVSFDLLVIEGIEAGADEAWT